MHRIGIAALVICLIPACMSEVAPREGKVGRTAAGATFASMDIAAICELGSTCCSASSFDRDLARCTSFFDQIMGLSGELEGVTPAFVAGPNVTVDDEAAAVCLSGIKALGCNDITAASYRATVQACFSVYAGRLGAGSPCLAAVECAPGHFCEEGVCAPLRAQGDACIRNDECSYRGASANGRTCNVNTGMCDIVRPDGQPCSVGFECASGLCDGVCLQSTTTPFTQAACTMLAGGVVNPFPVQISAGDVHTCARLTDGTVRCWGGNGKGQLGNGTTADSLVPVTVSGLSGVTSLSAGSYHTCALLADGTVRCWGNNEAGELGNGTIVDSPVPVTVSGLSGVDSVAAGQYHTCAVLTDGTVRCWGYNSEGQLGNGTTADSPVPVTVSGLSGVTSLSAGYYHSCAQLADGTVRCWGRNSSGQLGNGTTADSLVHVTVSGLSGVTSLSAGSYHTCAVLTNGTAMCFGYNDGGQLGNGMTTNSPVPVAVSGLSGIASMAGGRHHTCAVLTDGTARCWGTNSYGALGNGTTADSPASVTVSGLSGVTSLSAGDYYTCAIAGRSMRCWGYNFDGELGNGTNRQAVSSTMVLYP